MHYISDLHSHIDKNVSLKGWIINSRSSKGIEFIVFRDGTGFLQCIVDANTVGEETFEKAKTLTQESSVEISGKVVKDERQIGGIELQVSDLKIINLTENYPITNKSHGVQFLMDNRHLWLRSKRQWAIMRVRNSIIYAINNFFQKEGFMQMDAPLFTGNAAEGSTTLFETEFYDRPAYLSQTGQLYGEAMAMAMGRIYTFGPTFRAEKSKTRRHLSEFWMIEPEMAFFDNDMNMDLIAQVKQEITEREEILKNDTLKQKKRNFIQNKVDKFKNELTNLQEKASYIPQWLNSAKNFKYGEDLGGSDETVLTKMFSQPIMVYNWPKDIKAFYMKRDENNPNLVKGVDVLAPEGFGEIVGGAERETDYDILLERIREHNLPEEVFKWYLDLRKYGSVPHSGFGLGLERFVQWMTDTKHIREAIPFPRMYGRLEP